MPKANLRVLDSSSGPFHKAECSVCGERFYVLPKGMDFKEDMAKQFDAHLHNQHRRQWDARQKKKERIADENRRLHSLTLEMGF